MNQPPLNPDALAQLIMWKELPFGGNPDNYIRLDANAAHKVIELLEPHLTVAQPEVNSVEELDALPYGSLITGSSGVAVMKYDGPNYDWITGNDYRYRMDEQEQCLPARVLYRPEVKP